jgi:hypothetical protein
MVVAPDPTAVAAEPRAASSPDAAATLTRFLAPAIFEVPTMRLLLAAMPLKSRQPAGGTSIEVVCGDKIPSR